MNVIGIDISPGMVAQARLLNPGLEIRQGDMLALDVADESWAGVVLFYSIIHIPRAEVVRALRELARCLQRGGWLLVSFHIGDEVLHLDELWGHPVRLDFIFFRTEETLGYLNEAGFDIEETVERDPYPEVEYQSRRAYILARKGPVKPEG
jgi:SAM-dependent methyltransferase